MVLNILQFVLCRGRLISYVIQAVSYFPPLVITGLGQLLYLVDRAVDFFSPLVFTGPAVLILVGRAVGFFPPLAFTGLGQLLFLVVRAAAFCSPMGFLRPAVLLVITEVTHMLTRLGHKERAWPGVIPRAREADLRPSWIHARGPSHIPWD